jgi:signal transduction histidine kinase
MSRLGRARTVDAAVAVVAFALTLAVLAASDDGGRELDAGGFVLAALASLPLLFRRSWPLDVFVGTTIASAALLLLDYPGGPPFGPTIALFHVALHRSRVRTAPRATLGVVAAMFALHLGAGSVVDGLTFEAFVFGIPLWGAAWFAGDRTRLRRAQIASLEERARRAEEDAARERRLAAAEERMRIARDLHDSAGHAINVILVEAGAARLLRERDPARAAAALETIEEVARETVGEIDHLVRALREDGADDVEPPPGLAALDALVRRHRGSGLEVTVSRAGEPRPLAPGVDRAAYRILQEALTNAAKHGDGAATVEIGYGRDALELVVENPASLRPSGEGHGLVGMRERTTLLGGTLEARARGGAFRVLATLPYAADGGAAA